MYHTAPVPCHPCPPCLPVIMPQCCKHWPAIGDKAQILSVYLQHVGYVFRYDACVRFFVTLLLLPILFGILPVKLTGRDPFLALIIWSKIVFSSWLIQGNQMVLDIFSNATYCTPILPDFRDWVQKSAVKPVSQCPHDVQWSSVELGVHRRKDSQIWKQLTEKKLSERSISVSLYQFIFS